MDMNKYVSMGAFNWIGSLSKDSAIIAIPAGISPKRIHILCRNTQDKAVSLQLVGGISANFSEVSVNLETALALGIGNVTPTDGMISTERIFPFYKITGSSVVKPATGEIVPWFAMFE